MIPKEPLPEALFIRWGKLQIGAYGRLAILVFAATAAGLARLIGIF